LLPLPLLLRLLVVVVLMVLVLPPPLLPLFLPAWLCGCLCWSRLHSIGLTLALTLTWARLGPFVCTKYTVSTQHK